MRWNRRNLIGIMMMMLVARFISPNTIASPIVHFCFVSTNVYCIFTFIDHKVNRDLSNLDIAIVPIIHYTEVLYAGGTIFRYRYESGGPYGFNVKVFVYHPAHALATNSAMPIARY